MLISMIKKGKTPKEAGGAKDESEDSNEEAVMQKLTEARAPGKRPIKKTEKMESYA